MLGVNTARSLTFKDGRINERADGGDPPALRAARRTVRKIVVTHHPFDLPDQGDDDDLVDRARLAMDVFAAVRRRPAAGRPPARQPRRQDGRARYKIGDYAALVVQAGTATSTRGRGEVNSFNVMRVRSDEIVVERMSWRADAKAFALHGTERFVRDGARWLER